jgi:DNA-directed RNA polymerase subunit RPC12/RpoP
MKGIGSTVTYLCVKCGAEKRTLVRTGEMGSYVLWAFEDEMGITRCPRCGAEGKSATRVGRSRSLVVLGEEGE